MRLLPTLGFEEAWAVGLVIVLAILRPVGRLGWTAAGAIIVGGCGAVIWASTAGASVEWWLIPWLALAILLALTAGGRPLRWEPRTGPGAAIAMTVGAGVMHLGAAATVGGTALARTATAWGSGSLTAATLTPDTAGPLAVPLAWLVGAVPGVTARAGAAFVGLASLALIVAGCDRLGARWGWVGTARCAAAAVAWAPPLLLAHAHATAALMATAALVWGWWALGEVWGGRHLPDRMALFAGLLLGVAIGTSLWPALLVPLWLRRLDLRRAGWFVVGAGAALVLAVLSLVPAEVGLADVWQVGVRGALDVASPPPIVVLLLVAAALMAAVPKRPLSPTRLSAVTGAVLLATMPWWPASAAIAGPVAAIPFVLLAAVAPDRPGERWPPDAAQPSDDDVPVEAWT